MTTCSKGFLLLFCPISLALAGAFSPCDVNQDNATNILDVQRLINEAIGLASPAHDLNQDGKVTVADVQLVVNAVLYQSCAVGPQLTISDFNPKSGPAGTLVALTGSNFGATPQATMPKQGGGTIVQPLTAATATSASIVIAAGSATGAITVTSGGLSGSTGAAFTVTPSNTFSLTASPLTANLIAGQSISYAVQANSSSNFTSLAALGVNGIPNGVTASFKPSSITAGQTSILTLQAPAGQPIKSSNLTITASASVEGIAITQSAPVTLAVVAPTTTFMGRMAVSDALETPLVGVTITTIGQDGGGNNTGCTGHTTVSDAAGNFALTNLPPSCIGPQMFSFDGNTVTSPAGKYAGLNLVFTIVSSQVLVSPVLVHLPRSDNLETFQVTQNSNVDQSFTFKTIPGLAVTIYAGTVLTMPDGSQPNPFPFSAVELAIDRLPDQMPLTNSMVTTFIVSFPPPDTTASQPVAVWYPNTLNTPPGASVVLMTLDPTRGRMVAYGTGVISNDGASIVPDVDPSSGALRHRYGIVHFDWHGPAANPPNAIGSGPGCACKLKPGGAPRKGDPVDLASGLQIMTATDLAVTNSRGSLSISRTYRSGSTQILSMGIGSGFNFDYRLSAIPQTVSSVNLEMPDGEAIPFAAQPDGTMINKTMPSMAGAVLTIAQDGTPTLRFSTGSFLTFDSHYGIPLLRAIGDPNGNVIQIVHDPANPIGPITEIDDPVGRKFLVTNDSSIGYPLITSITDPAGRVVKYGYSVAGYLTSFTNVRGGVTTYAYDVQNRLTSVTDPDGTVLMQDTYDANGRVIAQTTPSGGVIHYAYTLSNALVPTSPVLQTVVTDPLGNVTAYRFNSQGFVVGVTDATGQTRVLTRDPVNNQLLAMSGSGTCDVCGNPAAGDVTFTYDSNGNKLSVTNSLGASTSWTYEPVFNHVLTSTDPLGNVTRFTYDSHGNLLTATSPKNETVSLTYSPFGQITRAVASNGGIETLTYDAMGNPTQVSSPTGHTTSFSYDAISRTIEAMDYAGNTASVAYDASGNVLSRTNRLGRTTSYAYDSVGLLLSTTDRAGNKTQFSYDSSHRPVSKTDPLGNTQTSSYDLAGNLVHAVDRRGIAVTLQYDALNRVAGETYSDGQTVHYTYDAAGRLIKVDDSSAGSFVYSYNPAGQMLKAVGPTGTVTYTRDPAGRELSHQVSGQQPVLYTYDADDNLVNVTSGTVSENATFDSAGLPLTLSRSNGVTTAISYDVAERLLSVAHSKGAAPLLSNSFAYDSMGRRSQVQSSAGQAPATQSAAGTVNANNQLLTFGADTYTYDKSGNRLTDSNAGGTTSYTWDSRDRLTRIDAPGGVTYSLGYDFAGNLLTQHVVTPTTDTLQQFVLDDDTDVAAISGPAGVSSVVTAPGLDQNSAVIDPQGNVQFGLRGALNSTSGVTDKNGALTGQSYYEPYGATTQTGAQYPFNFTGRNQVAPNLYYMRARFYDANTGRFISEDPIGLAGGSNLYRYAGNNPVQFRDPLGLFIVATDYDTNRHYKNEGGRPPDLAMRGNVTVDRTGAYYQVGVSTPPTWGKFGPQALWIVQAKPPTDDDLEGFNTGWSVGGSVGCGISITGSWSPPDDIFSAPLSGKLPSSVGTFALGGGIGIGVSASAGYGLDRKSVVDMAHAANQQADATAAGINNSVQQINLAIGKSEDPTFFGDDDDQ